MSDQNSNSPHEAKDSAPSGAEVVSPTREAPDISPEILERIGEVTREAVSVVAHEFHSGPMPAPKQLAQYDSVLPGTAQIIRDEFQANGAHVRRMEERALEAQKDDNDQNRKVAERLVWGALIASFVLALLGQKEVAGVIAVSTVGAVITGFLRQRYEAQHERPKQSSGEAES